MNITPKSIQKPNGLVDSEFKAWLDECERTGVYPLCPTCDGYVIPGHLCPRTRA